jgi:hypothetical protein
VGCGAARCLGAAVAWHGEDDEGTQVAQSAVRQYLGVARGLLLQDAGGLGAAIKLKEKVERIAAGDVEDAVAIGYGNASEETGESADAVPLRERAVSLSEAPTGLST